MYAPVALLLTGALALLASFSFAELSSRYPVSAGESRYVQEAFGRRWFSTTVGWMVILTGIVSAAALAVATIGFLQDFVAMPEGIGVGLLVLLMGAVAAWGIGQSVGVVVTITVIEVGALIYAVFAAESSLLDAARHWREFVPPLEGAVWTGMFSGAFLAFYAFIGFEDMVNIAEEVKDVRRSLPIAIVLSVVLTVLLYMLVAFVAVLSVPPAALAKSNTPIAEIAAGRGWYSTTGLGLVSILTGLNGALVQMIMASRVAYGLARQDQAPAWLGDVHPRTRTPVHSTLVVTTVVLALALFFPLTTLARVTSAIILAVFAMVSLALWRIKRRDPDLDGEGPRYPGWLPLLAAASCTGVLLFQGWQIING